MKAFITMPSLSKFATARDGMHTCDNDSYLRRWWEVAIARVGFSCTSNADAKKSHKTWFPYNKGGSFRKWEGNDEYIVNWENDGESIKRNVNPEGNLKAHGFNGEWGFRPSLTWSSVSSGRIAIRNKPVGFMFDAAGYSMFEVYEQSSIYVQAFCNSSIASAMLDFLSPTLNYQAGDILSLPFSLEGVASEKSIVEKVNICRSFTRLDWNAFEISWNFKRHPLV